MSILRQRKPVKPPPQKDKRGDSQTSDRTTIALLIVLGLLLVFLAGLLIVKNQQAAPLIPTNTPKPTAEPTITPITFALPTYTPFIATRVPVQQSVQSQSNSSSCPSTSYTCAALTCSQAYACLRAGNMRLDGDGDGVPCESICN